MKSIQKSNVALSLMLLTSVASSLAMRSALDDFEKQARSHRHQRRSPKTTQANEAVHSDTEDLTQGRINGGDNSPATPEQQNELEQAINGNNNNSNNTPEVIDLSNAQPSRFAGVRAKLASFFGYFDPRSYSRPALFTKDGVHDVGTRYVVLPAKAVFMPFSSKQEIIDARIEAKKARFKEGRIQNAAVKSTEFLNKHSYISNGVYYPALTATAYLSYKGARAAFKKACKWYNERQAEITLEDVLEKANRKVTGEITTSLAQAIQEDVNLSARINALSEAKRAAVNTVVEQLDRAYTLTNTQMKNQAISDVLTALTQVCQTA